MLQWRCHRISLRRGAPVLQPSTAFFGKRGSRWPTSFRVQYTVIDARLVDALVPVLGAALGSIRPAATLVIAGLMRPEMLVEIEVTAFKG